MQSVESYSYLYTYFSQPEQIMNNTVYMGELRVLWLLWSITVHEIDIAIINRNIKNCTVTVRMPIQCWDKYDSVNLGRRSSVYFKTTGHS